MEWRLRLQSLLIASVAVSADNAAAVSDAVESLG
jgi:hypothetical protein